MSRGLIVSIFAVGFIALGCAPKAVRSAAAKPRAEYKPPAAHQLIAYEGWEGEDCQIYVASLDGKTKHKLTSKNSAREKGCFNPLWSADGQFIYYTRDLGKGTGRNRRGSLWRIKADGTANEPLTDRSGFDIALRAEPDGSMLVDRTTKGGFHDLQFDSAGKPHLSDIEFADYPQPHGSLIAEVEDQKESNRLRFLKFKDQSGQEVKMKEALIQPILGTPAWSPDGKRLAYISQSGRMGGIAVLVDLEKKTVKKIKDGQDDRMTGISWSPDGQQITFMQRGTKRFTRLWSASTDGRKVDLVHNGLNGEADPVWTADSQHLILTIQPSHSKSERHEKGDVLHNFHFLSNALRNGIPAGVGRFALSPAGSVVELRQH